LGVCSLLPTLLNIKIILTQISISSSLRQIIQSQKDMVKKANNTSYRNDLLGLMLNPRIEEATIKGWWKGPFWHARIDGQLQDLFHRRT
jgi:hypothetical protein